MMLREYQSNLIQSVRKAYRDGFNAPCIVAPCGSGKSIIAAEIAKRTTDKGNSVLFIVHRQELCDQIARTFYSRSVDMSLCKIGMVQTICRRVDRIRPPSLIITDENHHSLAASYKKIYQSFPNAKRLGITATPVRLNGSGLGDVNDKLIESVSTKWLIENNFLSPFDYYSPSVTDLTGLKSSRGEYIAKDIESKLDKKAIYGDVIKYYRELSNNKQAICYCASISHSMNMADEFNNSGITAVHIDGETPKYERTRAINEFRKGNITILCNVDLISEGFDVPDCNTAILLRPTKSLTLYIQQSMRCMRYKDNKKAIIIDHVGNYARFGLPDAEREWELSPKETKKSKEELTEKVRQCPKCFYTHEPRPICPMCGFVYPVKERTLTEIKETKLEIIKGFVLNYKTPEDCVSMVELQEYAKMKNYKKGWIYYQAKARGFI